MKSSTPSVESKPVVIRKEGKPCYVPLDPENIEKVMHMYLDGVAIWDIGSFTGLSPDEINQTIDHFVPYL